MPAHKIGTLLTAPGELGSLSAKARRLANLQRLFLDCAPPQLARATRVKNFRAGILYLLVDNGAVAAKLRQMTPSLLSAIQKTETEVTGIHIQVQVKSSTKQALGDARAAVLSPETIDEFRALAERVADPNLQSALRKLVRRREQKK